MRKVLGVLAASVTAGLLAAAPSAAAVVPDCTGSHVQKTIYSGQPAIENLIVGGGGVLYTSGASETDQSLLSAFTKGKAAPRTVATGKPGGGGLAWDRKRLLWGYGDLFANGSAGDLNPTAGLYSVNVSSGGKRVVSDHLGMANGIARDRNGFVYASNNLGLKLDRISPEGQTLNGWASLGSANGLTVGKNGRYLYANQMFETPSTIAKIDLKDPSKIWTYFTSPESANVLFDGLTHDADNNLYAAVFGKGEVWKISPSRQVCVIASGLSQTTSVAISGAKKGFKAGNLYASGFDGKIVQVTGATKAGFPG
ncbi:MAG: SMP-30/gluconolactonase/LRE family protein [Solirubrobacterales bacterium]|nr:SMP-30/gluconolactonase/LRE family protein [Solirubrobacterales bacterium]MCB8915829.1 SMP-30/gluconolactonase/LRE family protein [Thermoleophilales bacterium]